MRVGIDVSSLDHEQISGVGTYITELANQLRSLVELTGFYRPSRYKRLSWIEHHFKGPLKILGGPSFNRIRSNVDVYHGLDYRIPRRSKVPRIVTVHDLAFFEEGMTSPTFATKKKRSLDWTLKKLRPEWVVTVSEATRRSLLDRYPEYEDRSFVTPLAADHLPVAPPSAKRLFSRPFFLFVGNIEARKNVLGAVKAFEIFNQKHPDAMLVIVGKEGFRGGEILEEVNRSPSKANIIRLGYIDNQELSRLYQQAIAMVLPSFCEGFGIPILEAMRNSCPVITGNVSGTKEVAESAGLLVDPKDHEEIASAMERALDADLRESLIRAGHERAGLFSWKKCAEQTLEVYRRAYAASSKNVFPTPG